MKSMLFIYVAGVYLLFLSPKINSPNDNLHSNNLTQKKVKNMQGILESKEIRWFFKKNIDHIVKWYSDKGIAFAKVKPRTDFYLSLPKQDDLGIKLREGNVEIKQRLGNPSEYKIAENATGYLEDWVKWSFDLDDNDKLSQSIITDKNNSWVEVYKERLGVKVTKENNGSIKIVDIKERIQYGCQIEYTRILVNGEEWFTFGLEWFGEDYLAIEDSLVNQITGYAKLESENSFGYSVFLNRRIKE